MAAITIEDSTQLRGVFPAIFTPLLRDDPKNLANGIDYEKAKLLIDDLIQSGVSGLVPAGTTGQSATLSPQQHVDFVKFVVDYVDTRVPVIAGAGSNNTRESIEIIHSLQKDFGRLAVLCVTGYYNNPPQEGILSHYTALSRETDTPIVIYNVPSRTGSYIEAETLIALSEDKNLIGLKQAVDFKSEGIHREETRRVITATRDNDFAVVTGEDDALHAILELGGQGIITATGNLPEAAARYQKMIASFHDGDRSSSLELQKEVDRLKDAVFCRKTPFRWERFSILPFTCHLFRFGIPKAGRRQRGSFCR